MMIWICVLLLGLAACAAPADEGRPHAAPQGGGGKEELELGNFSVSLAVADLARSRAFYEALGFRAVAGDAAQGWLVLQNGTATIGLFQGMFERNMLTFNPGWDRDQRTPAGFEDVRSLQRRLRERGIEIATPADESGTGPASFLLVDPDGNPILVDQHVPKPPR